MSRHFLCRYQFIICYGLFLNTATTIAKKIFYIIVSSGAFTNSFLLSSFIRIEYLKNGNRFKRKSKRKMHHPTATSTNTGVSFCKINELKNTKKKMLYSERDKVMQCTHTNWKKRRKTKYKWKINGKINRKRFSTKISK